MWETILPVQQGGLITRGLKRAAEILDSKDALKIEQSKKRRERIYHEAARTFHRLEQGFRSIGPSYGPVREMYESHMMRLGWEFIRHFAAYPWDLRYGVAREFGTIAKALNARESEEVEMTVLFHVLRRYEGGESAGESERIVETLFQKFRARDFLRLHDALENPDANELDYLPTREAQGGEHPPRQGTVVLRELPPVKIKVMMLRPAVEAVSQAS